MTDLFVSFVHTKNTFATLDKSVHCPDNTFGHTVLQGVPEPKNYDDIQAMGMSILTSAQKMSGNIGAGKIIILNWKVLQNDTE